MLQKEQEVFEKEMLDALEMGTCFCILHYDEVVPEQDDYNHDDGYMNEKGIAACQSTQIGFRWLRPFQIRPLRFDTPVISGDIKRTEFKSFLDRWGSSKNAFVHYREGKFGDVVYSLSDELAIGFVLPVRKGKLLYLPCQRDYGRPASVEECLTTLISSAITYLARSRTEVPPWAATPLFAGEEQLNKQLFDLQSKIDAWKAELQPFLETKTLAFLSEYEFEKAVPEFFTKHLGISAFRDEKYMEDFWLLNSQSEKIAIAEAKSHARGLKKSDIYSLYNHREANGLDDTFPALLAINAHLNARSWKEKLRPIDREIYRVAASHNILIVRVEDLLFFWNAIIEGQRNQDELLEIILYQNGWLQVKVDGSFVVRR